MCFDAAVGDGNGLQPLGNVSDLPPLPALLPWLFSAALHDIALPYPQFVACQHDPLVTALLMFVGLPSPGLTPEARIHRCDALLALQGSAANGAQGTTSIAFCVSFTGADSWGGTGSGKVARRPANRTTSAAAPDHGWPGWSSTIVGLMHTPFAS